MRGLDFGFTNSMGIGGVLNVCLCLGYGGVGGEWVGAWTMVLLHRMYIMLPTVYLFMADIVNPNLCVCGCRTWICLDITRFYEEQH